MLSTLSRATYRPLALWVRWAALLVLMVATPATKHVIESVALIVDEVCDDAGGCGDCEGEDEEGSGPRSCQHCSHCTPTSTLPPATAPVVSASLLLELEPTPPIEMVASGYRSQPFRPPAA